MLLLFFCFVQSDSLAAQLADRDVTIEHLEASLKQMTSDVETNKLKLQEAVSPKHKKLEKQFTKFEIEFSCNSCKTWYFV